MSVSTLARSLPAPAARRWRSLRLRTRVTLAMLAVALPVLSWVLLWNRPGEWPSRVVFDLPEKTYPLAFSPDGRTFLSKGAGGITPWDTSTARPGTPWESKNGSLVTFGVYSSDGRAFAVVTSVPPLATIELVDPTTGRTKFTLTTRHSLVFDLAFADDGRTLRAILGDSRVVKEAATWDVATGKQTSSRPINAPTLMSYKAFSRDGRILAFIRAGSTDVQLWDVEADASPGVLTNPSRAGIPLGRGLAFSPDGRTLAVTRSDGAIDLWDVPARELLKTLPVHPRGYLSMAIRFAPDGRTIASSGGEFGTRSALAKVHDEIQRGLFGSTGDVGEEMIVVDIATGRRVGRTSSSYYPMYTPDGRTIVTRREDLKLHLLDLKDAPK